MNINLQVNDQKSNFMQTKAVFNKFGFTFDYRIMLFAFICGALSVILCLCILKCIKRKKKKEYFYSQTQNVENTIDVSRSSLD